MSMNNKGRGISRIRRSPNLASTTVVFDLFVCGCECGRGCWCGWSIPSTFLLLQLVSFSQLTFCVSSQPTPIPTAPASTTINYPPTSPLKSTEAALGDHHFRRKIVLALSVSVSALFLVSVLLFLMAFFTKLLRIKKLRRKSTNQDQASGVVSQKVKDDDTCSARKFSWDDIERFSNNFSQMIGSGGFSDVYLARLPDSTCGAIKIHVGGDRLNQVFKQELDILLRLCHENIVKLLGYCDDKAEGALVFEYVPNGSLQEKLHGRSEETETILPWRSRMEIAFQLAQAIEYLHEKCTLHIVHGDIKASNILLDEHLNCKLCDFGSAKMGFSSVLLPPSCSSSSSASCSRIKQVMIGSPGYTDPHYLRTGLPSTKNDVFSFGVVILELVTGMEAFCPERGQLLTSIAAPLLKNVSECESIKVVEMVDPRLAGDFDLVEARAMLSISALCLRQSPVLRPSAAQILHTIKDKISSISYLLAPQKDSANQLPLHGENCKIVY